MIDKYEYLEKNGVFIHYLYDHYKDGTNCNFSIEFRDKKTQTGWYGDNNEFGGVKNVMITSINFALWYLENPKYIDLINSGYHNPDYIKYQETKREFIKKYMINE